MRFFCFLILFFLLFVGNLEAQQKYVDVTLRWAPVERLSDNQLISKYWSFGRYYYTEKIKYNVYYSDNEELANPIKLNTQPIFIDAFQDKTVFTYTHRISKEQQNTKHYFYVVAYITENFNSGKSNVVAVEYD